MQEMSIRNLLISDTPNSNPEMGMDNEEKKSVSDVEEYLDLVIETDDWAASPIPPLSPYEEDKSQDSANR